MYHRFENLRDDQLKLRAFVQDLNKEELIQLVQNIICQLDATKILDDLLQAFYDSDEGQLKRQKLIEYILKNLGKVNISTGQVNTIINWIIADFPRYSKQHLVKFVDFCVKNIRNDADELQSWKDLLPALFEALENEKYIVHADTEVSGIEYKTLIVKDICNYDWNVNFLPSLAKMFGDMALDKINRNEVLKTLCSALPNLPLDQVPSFTYQTLKLCTNRDNQKLLSALSKYFDLCYSRTNLANNIDNFESIDVINLREIQDIESTVLYHIYQATQLNHENMKDFIRFLKHVSYAPEYILQSFILCVLMSVSDIYEDQIFEILKLAIVHNTLEKEKRQNSAWLRQFLPSPCNIIGIIQQVIDSSNKERHLVLKGLTNLAFTLMSADQKSKNNATAMWCIGSEIIREIIKKRHETIPIVLQELINKIVAGNMPTIHYTDCLKYMCRELSMIVLEHQTMIMIILERLLLLQPKVATQVLYAIFPLIPISPNVRENLLLTLRKALYRKGTSKRQMAVTGFIEMLKYKKMHCQYNFRLSQLNSFEYTSSSNSKSTLTQVTLEYNSQSERSLTEYGRTLCYEILDILKKSFTYEFEVRLHLYEGLYNTAIKNPEIVEIILDMLFSHLNLYLHADSNILPPIKLELCTDIHGMDVVMQEPIAQLIFALQKIYINTITKNSSTSEKIYNILELLCEKMTIIELEHLNLEHGTDFFHGESKSQIKLKNLSMAIEICEALIAFRIGEWSKGNDKVLNNINDLFKAYTRLVDFIKMQSTKVKKIDNGKKKKNKDINNTTKKSIKSNNIKIPNTIMDLDVIRQSLLLLFSQSTQNDVILRKNHNFCYYILQICEQLLQQIKLSIKDISQSQNHRYLNMYIDIGRLLYKHFIQNIIDALTNDAQVTILALQCFKEISYCVCTLLSFELQSFLNSIFEIQSKKDSISKDINFQLQEIIFSLKEYLEKFLTEDINDNDEKKKVSCLLLEIMEQYTYKINFENYNPDKMLKCIKKMIQIENIQSSIVPAILQFFLHLEEHTQQYGETLNEICMELCEKVGTIDGTELIMNKIYKIIREDTILQIYNVLNNHIKQKLDNASWLLMRLKAEDIIVRAPGTIDEVSNNNLKEKERNLCKQLSYLAQVLQTLANTSIESSPCIDNTFKNLQYLYHLLGNLTKYFYTKSNIQNAAFQAVKFIQLVQLAGKPLKSTFYNLVTYVEENQNKLQSKSDSYAQRNKILKETKIIPRVVYEIEQFNKEILLLGKRTCIPLENYMKHSITRDFRIKNPELVEGLEKMDTSLLGSSSLENSENENPISNADDLSDNDDNTIPSKKQCRTED